MLDNHTQEMQKKCIELERELDAMYKETQARILWRAAFYLRAMRHAAGPALPDLQVKFDSDGKMTWQNKDDMRDYFDVLSEENQVAYKTIIDDIKREGDERE